MHLVYIDDSRDEKLCVFSALSIPAQNWKKSFQVIKDYRRGLSKSDGIYPYAEFHAWKFVSGRGRIAARMVSQTRRCRIFVEALEEVSKLPGARLFNAVFPAMNEDRAFERMLNRINRTMEVADSHAVLICDEGKENVYTRLVRKMGVYNPIPSQYGVWPDSGNMTRNIPIERIIEDPVFKRSDQSYFIQMVDFCAYALLRRENPLASKSKFGIDKAFNELASILVTEASRKDPEGIIRP